MANFKPTPAAAELLKLKRKLHNLRFILFAKFFVDTRNLTKVVLLNKVETCSQYAEMKNLYLKKREEIFFKRWLNRARFFIWKFNVNNSTKKFDEELWQ